MQKNKNDREINEAKVLASDRDDMVVVEKIDELIKDEKFLAQLAQSDKKVIEIGSLTESIRHSFSQIIEELNDLRDEVLKKKDDVVCKSHLINKRVDELLHSGKIQVDQQEYKNSEVSVTQYTSLLDGICEELVVEMEFFRLILGDRCPGHVVVNKDASDSFDRAVEGKIKNIKHHIKSIGLDSSVSYSRYCYGFDAQVKRIEHVEALVKAR